MGIWLSLNDESTLIWFFLLFSLSLSILWLTRLMGIWSGHVPSAAIVQTERHWSDLRIDDHHSLRWTQANVDDHCTLEVNKKHLLACWVWNKIFVESNAIIENNLLCFWGWKTLKACFIVNISWCKRLLIVQSWRPVQNNAALGSE